MSLASVSLKSQMLVQFLDQHLQPESSTYCLLEIYKTPSPLVCTIWNQQPPLKVQRKLQSSKKYTDYFEIMVGSLWIQEPQTENVLLDKCIHTRRRSNISGCHWVAVVCTRTHIHIHTCTHTHTCIHMMWIPHNECGASPRVNTVWEELLSNWDSWILHRLVLWVRATDQWRTGVLALWRIKDLPFPNGTEIQLLIREKWLGAGEECVYLPCTFLLSNLYLYDLSK